MRITGDFEAISNREWYDVVWYRAILQHDSDYLYKRRDLFSVKRPRATQYV